MSRQYTYTDALARLNLAGTEEDQRVFNMAGQTPQDLMGHELSGDYTILGITPNDFINERAGVSFDYGKMKTDFFKICPDFGSEMTENQPTMELEFCSKILYEVGPESRKVGQTKRDKVWKFRFPRAVSTGSVRSLGVTAAYVSTFKINQVYNYTATDKVINLSVKHATLLAMDVFDRLVEYACSKLGRDLLTPLAGAVFSLDCIDLICLLTEHDRIKVLQTINASATSGGHVLAHSDASVALVIACSNTSQLVAKGKKDVRDSILLKTAKQYTAAKKEFDEQKFTIYCICATGGLPSNMKPSKILKMYKKSATVDVGPIKADVIHEAVTASALEVRVQERRNDTVMSYVEKEGGMTHIAMMPISRREHWINNLMRSFGYKSGPRPGTSADDGADGDDESDVE